MGILDALRVQKAGQKSVQELSQLPQQEIIKMAQMGQIPADVVPVIISEKARMAQQAAQAQAMQQQRPPTVMEQAMQLNAQQEQKGLPAIPTQGMFQPQNYRGGGIVGYAGDGEEGQLVGTSPIISPRFVEASSRQEPNVPTGPNFERSLRQAREALKDSTTPTKEEQELSAMLSKPDMDKQQMLWMSLLRGGLKGLASGSQHAGVAIGEGLSEAAKSYDEGLKEMKKSQLAYAKERADLAKGRRQEGVAAATLAEKLYSNEATLQAAMEKAVASGNLNAFVRLQVEAAQEAGDSRSPKVIAAEAAKTYVEMSAALGPRAMSAAAAQTGAGAQVSQAGTAATKADIDAQLRRDELERKKADENDKNRRDAAANVKAALADPDTELRKRIRREGRDKVREDLMKQELGVYGLSAPRSAPPSGFKPQGSGQLPPGFQLVR